MFSELPHTSDHARLPDGRQALIIANGALPPRQIVRPLVSSADIVICADGGANAARRLRIQPDIILGDFDSIQPSTRKFFRRVPQLLIDDQNSTDMEKALQYCAEREISSVDVVGATGNRIDHTTGSLGCLKKFGDRLQLRFIDAVGELSMVRGSVELSTNIGDKLSLIPLERCTGVTTANLKYALDNDLLELGVREGISNEAIGHRITISVRQGTLLLYRFHKTKR